MPFKRTYKRKRLYKRPLRRLKRRLYKKRIPRGPKRTMLFKRYAGSFTVSTSSSTGSMSFDGSTLVLTRGASAGTQFYSLAFAYKLSDLPDYSEFTALFDTYKICGVALRIIPLFSEASTATASAVGGIGIVLHSTSDYDDVSNYSPNEANINYMREVATYKCHNLLKIRKWSRYLKPAVRDAVYDGTTLQPMGQKKNKWIDCSNADILHYGTKMIIETYSDATIALKIAFKVEAKYYLALKQPI